MKNTVFVLFILPIIVFSLISYRSACQNTSFSFKYSTAWDEVPTHSIESADGGFIISAKQGDMSSYDFHTLFISLNKWGDTIKTATIYDSTGNCFIYQMLPGANGNFFAIGSWQRSPQETNIWLVKMNSNLDVLWEKWYATACYDLHIALGLINHSGDLILYGTGNFAPDNTILVYRCSQDGDSLGGVRLTQPSHVALAYDMAEKADSSGYYLLIGDRYLVNTNSWGQILRFDTALNITSTDSIPRMLYHYYNLVIPGNKIILTGMKPVTGSNPTTNKLGLLQLDTSYNVLKERHIGPDDTISYPGYIHNLAMIDTLNFYYGGTLNQDNNAIFSPKKSWFLLGKYDTDLNVKWQKYYGGDLNYGLWSLKATSDGGCLMAGSTFDYLTQNNERDIFIVKTDSAGIMTGANHDQPPVMHQVMVYPNPGTDQLFAETDLRGVTFSLADISGKTVFTVMIDHSPFLMDTGLLNTGQYIYLIQRGITIIDTGKWIKE